MNILFFFIFRETNDGGATNDEEIRRFTIAAGAELENVKCDSYDCSTKGLIGSTYNNKMENFKVTVINPAGSGSINGLKVIRQIVPMRESTIKVLGTIYLRKIFFLHLIF